MSESVFYESLVHVKVPLEIRSTECEARNVVVNSYTTSEDFFDLLECSFPNFFLEADMEYVPYTSCGTRVNRRTPMQSILSANFLYLLDSEVLTPVLSKQLFANT